MINNYEVFYFSNIKGVLHGAILTHVDNFEIAGTPEFLKKVIDMVERELTVSKIEDDNFRFTGHDVKVVDDGIGVSMNNYTNRLQYVKNIRKVEN